MKEKFKDIPIETTFQSRFGPDEWLTPYTDKALEELPSKGKKNVLMICPGFSADCVETLEEIAIQGKESFIENGGENYDIVPCLNMEKRLMKIIMNPAMIITWLSGLSVLWILGFNNIFSLWLSIKFLLVIALSGYHGFLSKCLKDFEFDRNKRSSKFFRVINEIPTIILIIIVFLVIFKPA